ncbi:cell envelope integrity protein TolA [Candidatus Liberibacter solanacearum]|nr:cell envelope integrity protein TolA [Candidatus Liberibacter solanacearum]
MTIMTILISFWKRDKKQAIKDTMPYLLLASFTNFLTVGSLTAISIFCWVSFTGDFPSSHFYHCIIAIWFIKFMAEGFMYPAKEWAKQQEENRKQQEKNRKQQEEDRRQQEEDRIIEGLTRITYVYSEVSVWSTYSNAKNIPKYIEEKINFIESFFNSLGVSPLSQALETKHVHDYLEHVIVLRDSITTGSIESAEKFRIDFNKSF